MEFWLWMILFILGVVIVVLAAKILLMQKAAGEIGEAFEEKLKTDTNTLITLSGGGRHMRELAAKINTALRELHMQRRRFENGDMEVKNAITNISHDIRTPLTAIYGYLELLEEEEVSETAAEYIKIIRNRTEMLRKLSEEFFDYSVSLSSDLGLKEEAVDVNRVLQESIAAFYVDFLESKITPKIRITENRIVCRGDSAALSRVFSNLLNNAVKYSDGDLEIVLSENGEITFANTASALTNIEVSRLFDRFFTVENARKSTGLGLSISKLLIEKMGGEITAEHENGRLTIHVMPAKAELPGSAPKRNSGMSFVR